MTAIEYPAQDFYAVPRNSLYTSSIAPSATTSVVSVFSDASSQQSYASNDTTTTTSTAISIPCSYAGPVPPCHYPRPKPITQLGAASHLEGHRANPRRTSHSATSRTGCPPPLVRQVERKHNFVDNLVDSSTQIVEAIWPTSSVACRAETQSSSVLPLRTFIQETLRRSRTSYSTLQVALYYLVLVKDRLPERDFTMEQLEDSHASRALQCGRRMFLAALILASKYLQDRNYSARAWSKISGLNTQEINQNEMAFLLAVNWNLHITEQVYYRWTESVMKYSPSQPPAPGSGFASVEFERECDYFKRIILRLNPDLENLDEVLVTVGSPVPSLSERSFSPRTVLAAAQEDAGRMDYGDATPTPRSLTTPSTMEPSPSLAPSLSRLPFGLPTPRLTPQVSAVRDSSPPRLLSNGPAMSMAVSAAGAVHNGMIMDRWPITSSPQNYFTTRRSSLANSVSTASSPESMISDSSRTSRASSISSASSFTSAPYANLEVQARCRSAKLMSERCAVRPTVSSIAEDAYGTGLSCSPSYYTPVARGSWDMNMDKHLARRHSEVDEATSDAARALQQLKDNWGGRVMEESATSAPRLGSKRSRPLSIDHGLQQNVREMLRTNSLPDSTGVLGPVSTSQVPAPLREGRKRVCCSAEAVPFHPAMNGYEGPGMWAGILN